MIHARSSLMPQPALQQVHRLERERKRLKRANSSRTNDVPILQRTNDRRHHHADSYGGAK
jgi:hypothetical protein